MMIMIKHEGRSVYWARVLSGSSELDVLPTSLLLFTTIIIIIAETSAHVRSFLLYSHALQTRIKNGKET